MSDPERTEPASGRRPQPEYGEYAPEGWEWKPEAEATPEPGAAESGLRGSSGAPAWGARSSQQQPEQSAARASGAGPVPGVPHNLGAGSALPHKGARTSQQGDGAPYRAEAPAQKPQQFQAPTGQQPQQPQQPLPGVTPATRPRSADKIITIVLLAIGAIGALQLAAACFGMSTTFAMLGDTPGIEPFTGPSWLGTAGKVTGVVIFALYALTLIYSIRRVRAGKLTFWVPLTAGVVALLIVIVLTLVAMLNTPELMASISDPTLTQKLMENAQNIESM